MYSLIEIILALYGFINLILFLFIISSYSYNRKNKEPNTFERWHIISMFLTPVIWILILGLFSLRYILLLFYKIFRFFEPQILKFINWLKSPVR